MASEFIRKTPQERARSLMPDYEDAYRTFTWVQARAELAGLPEGRGINMGYEAVSLGSGVVLDASPDLYQAKVAPIRDRLPSLRHVLVTGEGPAPAGTTSLAEALRTAQDEFTVPATRPDQPALLHFTSATTGLPKGAVHVHEAVAAHRVTARYVLDLREDDVYWCTADPGWVTGMSYGVIAPLALGATIVVDEGEFDPRRWYGNLERQGVTVRALLRRQRDRRRWAAARGGAGAGREDDRDTGDDGLPVRRWRRGGGRVPREPQPRRAVAPARAVLLREQPLRHGDADRPGPGRGRPRGPGRRLRPDRDHRGRHGRGGGAGGRHGRCAALPGRARAPVPGTADLPVPGPLHV